MRLLKRALTRFDYRACKGKEEILADGRHTGRYQLVYDDPVVMTGNISAPKGFANDRWFGIETKYTHVLLVDDPNTCIREDGLIIWNNETYEVRAVRPSLNMTSIALRKRRDDEVG